VNAALAERLTGIVGPDHVLTDPDLTARYETDWTGRFSGRSRLVVRPATTEETAGVLRACAAAGAAVVPQGGNTGLVGGGVPRGGEVLLSTARLNRTCEVDAQSMTATAGAGVTLAELHTAAADTGAAFGVDLAARDSATVGGMVATNAGGIHVLRHGSMRAQVLGVEAVLADGTVLRRMGALVKDNTGYDLPGLLTGSEGTLGVITAAVLRLVPAARHRVTALLGLGSLEDALAVSRALRALPTLEALEVMFDAGVELVRAHTDLPVPLRAPHPCYLLVECAGPSDPTDDLAEALDRAPQVAGAAVAADRPGRAALWAYRERHTEAVSALGVAHKLDVTLPLAQVAHFVATAPELVERAAPGAVVHLWGHLGDGNLHVNILGPDPEDPAVDDAVLRFVADLGGSISAEHGIGAAKRHLLSLTRGPEDLAAMRAIKDALDPDGRLNPGALFP
jgi:FAD/FMN-containing dehydrogenase